MKKIFFIFLFSVNSGLITPCGERKFAVTREGGMKIRCRCHHDFDTERNIKHLYGQISCAGNITTADDLSFSSNIIDAVFLRSTLTSSFDFLFRVLIFDFEFRFRVSISSFDFLFRVLIFDFEFRFRVLISSFNFEFLFRVSISSFDFEFGVQVSITSFNFEFRVRFLTSCFDFGLEYRFDFWAKFCSIGPKKRRHCYNSSKVTIWVFWCYYSYCWWCKKRVRLYTTRYKTICYIFQSEFKIIDHSMLHVIFRYASVRPFLCFDRSRISAFYFEFWTNLDFLLVEKYSFGRSKVLVNVKFGSM